MDSVKVLFRGNEVEIPKSELDWFVKEKGAEVVDATKNTTNKKETKTQNTDE